jgi:hypothetical protein
MQNLHTFGSQPATVADAAKIIKDYVEGSDQPVDNGLLALDGDESWVTDTPADGGTAIFADAGLSSCGTKGKVQIPVHFSNGTNHTYDLEPDRTNVMSYFACTDLANPVRLSSQQARRVKDAIETGIRSNLVALKGGEIAGKLKKKGSAHAGSISDVQLANIGDGRVVTAVINGSDELELITWQVSADGETITRKGKATGPVCKKVSIVNLGLGMVATGMRTAADNLKIILWKVDADGNIKRKKDDEGGGIKDLRLARVGKEYVAAACQLMDDSFKLIVWHVAASGDIGRHGSATAGTVTALAAISEFPVYFAKEGRESETFGPVLTAVRDGSDNLLLINWIISSEGDTVTRGGDASAGKVKGISAGYLPYNQCVTPVVDSDGELRIISWNLSAEGRVIDRWDTTQAGAISEVDCAGLGFDLFLTACRQADGKTKTILWRSVAGGAAINRVGDVVTGTGSQVRVTQIFPSVAAVAMRDGSGNLSLTAFRIS